MKLIIAGSRTLDVPPEFIGWCCKQFDINGVTEIVSGKAKGVDTSGEQYAALCVASELIDFPADWNAYGKAAGHIRNKQMAEYADALLLIWDGESKGSANMKKQMVELDKPIYEIILKMDMTNVKVY